MYIFILAIILVLSGCRSASWHREKADLAANANLTRAQTELFGRADTITTGPAADALRLRLLQDHELANPYPLPIIATNFPTLPDPLLLTPVTALQIAARNSPAFQEAKEDLFRSALGLDLEQAEFRAVFASQMEANVEEDRSGAETVRGLTATAPLGVVKTFQNGIEWSGSLAVDLVRLLTQESASSLGILADTGISIPLLRGSGKEIAAEPLRQAERNLLYAVMTFERFKRTFAFDVLNGYLDVLLAANQIEIARQNYESLTLSRERARRLTDAGRLPAFQFDQTVQDELRARNRWIDAQEQFANRLDRFIVELGLPPDARIELDDAILQEWVSNQNTTNSPHNTSGVPQTNTAAATFPSIATAMQNAIENRMDLRIARMRIEDAERQIHVAEDALRPELTLGGRVRAGESRASLSAAAEDHAELDLAHRRSSALLSLDLALDRRSERIAYRRALLALDATRRAASELEDRVKLEMRDAIRQLHQTREALSIQRQAATLAEKRVHSTDMFLQAGRAQIRDVLEAREALVNARNALASAAVNHRLAQLRYQRDADLLEMTIDGNLQEHWLNEKPTEDITSNQNPVTPDIVDMETRP